MTIAKLAHRELGIVLEASAWRWMKQWVPSTFGFLCLTSEIKPDRLPNMAGAHTPASIFQLRFISPNNVETTAMTSLHLLSFPRAYRI